MSEANRLQINITTDWNGEPGLDPMGVGLPCNKLDEDPAHVCLTVIAMVLQPHPERARRHTQALAVLSAYAGGAAVTYQTAEFRLLERRVLNYMDVVGDIKYHGTRNWEFANYVHKRAVERAKREKLI